MVKYTSSAYVKVYPYFKKGGFTKFVSIIFHANQLTEFIWDELDQLNIYFGEGNGTPLQHSCLENPMDGEALWAAVHGVAKSRTWLSNFTFTFHFHPLEKEMATHSSVLAWRIPGTGEPGRLPSMGLHRVGHDWSDLAVAAVFHFLDVPSLFTHSPTEGHLGCF